MHRSGIGLVEAHSQDGPTPWLSLVLPPTRVVDGAMKQPSQILSGRYQTVREREYTSRAL